MSKFISNVAFNSLGELGSRLPFIVTELYIAKTLGVANYGLWAIIQLIVNYNNFSHFGLLSGLAKLEPLNINKGSALYLQGLRTNAFYPVFVFDLLLLAALLLLGVDSIFSGFASSELVWSLVCLVVVQQLWLYAQTRLQNIVNFKLLSIAKLLYATLFMLFVLLLPGPLVLTKLVYCWALAYGLASVFIYLRANLLPSITFNSLHFSRLMVVGFPIFIMGIVKLLLVSMDKLFLIEFFEPEDIGIYNISLQAMLIMTVVIGLMSRVFSPIFLSMSTTDSNKSALFYQRVKSYSFIGGVVIAFLCCIAFTLIIKFFLPEYSAGILPGVILIFSGIYQGGVQLSITGIIAANKEKQLLGCYILFGLGYGVMLSILAFEQVALWAMALANLIFWLLTEVLISRWLLKESYNQLLLPVLALVFALSIKVLLIVSLNNTIVYLVASISFILFTMIYIAVKSGVSVSRITGQLRKGS